MTRIRPFVFSLLMLTLFSASAFAQTRQVSGRVTVEGSGEPLAAASVSIVGTTLGTYTDEQGRFSLSVPDGPVTLRVRRIGFAQRTAAVGAGNTELTVGLTRDVLQLETQVVTGTATTVSSINAANAVTVVSSERLNRVPAQTLDQALAGKVPGAQITQNTGAPGGGTQIQLRGVSTLNAGFEPLYVIDGVIVDNTSLQGGLNTITHASRAGNLLQFSSSQDQNVNRASDINPNDIESVQILKGPSAGSIYGSRGTNGVIIITTKQGQAGGRPTLDLQQRFGTARLANKLPLRCFTSAAEVRAAGHDSTGWGSSTNKCHDYQQEFYGARPFNYQTIASIRGGTQAGTTFFMSGLVQHDGGLVKNDLYNKQSLRINLGQPVGSRLRFNASLEGIHSLTNRGVSGNDNSGVNPINAFSWTPSFINLQRNPDGSFPRNPVNVVRNSNPFQNAEIIKTPEEVFRILAAGTAAYNIVNQKRQTLDFTLRGGLDSYIDHAEIISPATAYVEQFNALPGTLFNSDAKVMNATLGAAATHRLIRDYFTATTSFGFGQVRRNVDVIRNTGRGVFPGVTNIGSATQIFTEQTQSVVKSGSFFVQEEFLTLGERLLLTAAVNSERTSNNGDAQKYYAYPKFSASYRTPTPGFVDELKLRLAYGRAGNQPTTGKYTFLTNLVLEGVTGFRASTIRGFPGIKPETASEIEGGFDLTMLTGRARLSATQFRKQIDNLLLSASVAPSTGFSSQAINGGQIVTHGTELELGITPIQRERFSWISQTTYASNKGKVTRLPVPGFIPSSGSFGTRFGNAFIQQGQLVTVMQVINGCTVLETNGTCLAANRILTFRGNSAPDYTMGFSNDFNFGPMRLSSLLDWRKGGLGANLTNNYLDAHRMHADTALGAQRLRDWNAGKAVYVENTGFVKLREITLGYELPESMTGRLFNGGAQRARVELSGRNLKTWTKYTGLDPEVSNFGNQPLGRFQDVTPYPPSRTYFLTINTTF
ncbi:MAG TPA: SusC/RagA family TonB-linked outer membrane protein [Gemmatimonadaceae bacterium]|nr:SusC/RagA family TonB-linked outer membrane protein [Gemmatimonadaceae bacterium]